MAASERDEAARAAWREAVAQLNPEQLVFVDESGTHTSLARLYGWAPHDQRATGVAPRNHTKNTTVVAALTTEGMQAPWTIEGGMDTAAFEQYVKQVLGPTLRPGKIDVLDNLRVHKADSIREAIEARRCQLLFLPPLYSPDFTPIEQAFSKLKALLRGMGARAMRPCWRPSVWRWTPSPATMQSLGSPTRVTPCLIKERESCCNPDSDPSRAFTRT